MEMVIQNILLPQAKICSEEAMYFFRENYQDKTMYFELTEDFKKDSRKFTKYAEHVLQIMAHPVV